MKQVSLSDLAVLAVRGSKQDSHLTFQRVNAGCEKIKDYAHQLFDKILFIHLLKP